MNWGTTAASISVLALTFGILQGCATARPPTTNYSYLFMTELPADQAALDRQCTWLRRKITQHESFLRKQAKIKHQDGWDAMWQACVKQDLADLQARYLQVQCDVLSPAATAPEAGSSSDHQAEYAEYMAAFEAGDAAAAIKHGEAAWLAAEQALGEHPTTAILAYNFARLAAPYFAVKALRAYERAFEISRSRIVTLPLEELELGIAELELRTHVGWAAHARALEHRLEARLAAGTPASEVSAMAWRTLALQALRQESFERSERFADRAAADAAGLDPPERSILAESLVLEVVSRMNDRPQRSTEGIHEAVEQLDRAIDLYPAQLGIDTFDRGLAQALAWRLALGNAAHMGGPGPRRPSAPPAERTDGWNSTYVEATEQGDVSGLVRWKGLGPDRCAGPLNWAEQPPPVFRSSMLRKGTVGTLLVGFDVQGDKVRRAIVLADMPRTGFGEVARQAMLGWRLGDQVTEPCGKGRVYSFTFAIE